MICKMALILEVGFHLAFSKKTRMLCELSYLVDHGYYNCHKFLWFNVHLAKISAILYYMARVKIFLKSAKWSISPKNNYKLQITLSTWFMRFSLMRFSFEHIFKTVPKYLIHAVYPLFDRVNPSFVHKFEMICIIDLICACLLCKEFF